MIIDPPDDLYDVPGWQTAVDKCKGIRDRVDADFYDYLLGTLQEGLRFAMTGPVAPTNHGNIRERIAAARAANNQA